MDSIYRVGGAIIVGAGLIGIALFVQNRSSIEEDTEVSAMVVARGDVRTVQPALDSDKDNIPDWEETLRGTDPHAYTEPIIASETSTSTTNTYTPPTTLTDKFAEYFFEDMVRTRGGEPMTEEAKAALVERSVDTLARATADKLYTQADIKSTAENDLPALHTYGNELGNILFQPSGTNGNELEIMGRAVMTDNDPETLKALAPIEQAYAEMVSGFLALKTPSSLAKQHVDLINKLATIRSNLSAMQKAFSDPLGALLRVQRYEDDVKGLLSAIENIRTAFETNGVAYTSEEPGIFLFSLRP